MQYEPDTVEVTHLYAMHPHIVPCKPNGLGIVVGVRIIEVDSIWQN